MGLQVLSSGNCVVERAMWKILMTPWIRVHTKKVMRQQFFWECSFVEDSHKGPQKGSGGGFQKEEGF